MQQDSLESSEASKVSPNLFKHTVKGGFWVFAIRFATQLLSVGRLVVLARFLEIEDMGLLGIGMLIIQILNTFTTTGFQQALIQKKENIHTYLDTVWTVGIIRAVVLFAVLYFAAPYAAMLRVEPEKVSLTISIIRVIGVTLLISAVGNIATVYFRKELQFHKQFVYQISGTVVDSIITITIALTYRSIWALVIGKLAGTFVKSVLGYIIYPYKPAIKLDLTQAGRLWKFGKWILGGTVLNFLMTQGDDIYVWAYLGVTALALYQMAYKFSNLPATEITNVISQVTFPVYSKLQDDIPRLKDAYLKILQFTAFLSMPIGGLIYVLAPDFVLLFLTERWLPIVLPMQILAIFGLFRSLGATRGPLFNATGKPSIGVRLKFIKLIILVIIIYPLSKYMGVSGVALAVTLQGVIVYPLGFYMTMKIVRSGVWEMFKPIVYPFFSTIIMLGVVYFCQKVLMLKISFTAFFLKTLIGGCVYLTAIYICERFFNYGIIDNFKSQLNVFAGRKADLGADGG